MKKEKFISKILNFITDKIQDYNHNQEKKDDMKKLSLFFEKKEDVLFLLKIILYIGTIIAVLFQCLNLLKYGFDLTFFSYGQVINDLSIILGVIGIYIIIIFFLIKIKSKYINILYILLFLILLYCWMFLGLNIPIFYGIGIIITLFAIYCIHVLINVIKQKNKYDIYYYIWLYIFTLMVFIVILFTNILYLGNKGYNVSINQKINNKEEIVEYKSVYMNDKYIIVENNDMKNPGNDKKIILY